jgi:predicted ATPase
MLTELILANFKCFHRRTPVPLKQFTLLTGVNSTGKSTAIQPLLIMHQSVDCDESARQLYMNGRYVSLGRFSDVRSAQASRSDAMEVAFTFADSGGDLTVTYGLSAEDRDDSLAAVKRFEAKGNRGGKVFTSGWDINHYPSPPLRSWNNLIPGHVKLPTAAEQMIKWDNIHYISADRLGPQEYFVKHSFPQDMFVGPRGEYSGSVLLAAKQTEVRKEMGVDTGATRTVPDQAAAWLARLFGEAHLDVRATETNILLLLLSSESSPSRLYRPSNVGFGYSYALPIIVSALIAKPGQLLIVENPEAHLHPSAQAQLILMLVRLAMSGVQVVVETHSDHVLNALRVAVAEKFIRSDELNILFFESGTQEYFRNIQIEPDGMIDLPNWPEGFFDQSEHDFARLYKG